MGSLIAWLWANPIAIGFGLVAVWLIVSRIRNGAGSVTTASRRSEVRAMRRAERQRDGNVVAMFSDVRLPGSEDEADDDDSPTTTKKRGSDDVAVLSLFGLVGLLVAGFVDAAIIASNNNSVGPWAIINPWTEIAVVLFIALMVVYALHGEGGAFWHVSPRLLWHEVTGLWRFIDRDPASHARHAQRRHVIRAEAHQAHEAHVEAMEAEKFRKLMLKRLEAGRHVLERAVGDVLRYTTTEKVPKKETTVGKDGTKTTRTVWVDQQVAHTRAKVYAELAAPTVGLYYLRWLEGYDPQVAARWEHVCADAVSHLRFALGSLSPDDCKYGEDAKLTVVLARSERVEAPPAPEPEVEEIEPEPQVDDESPVVPGGPPLNLIPVGKRATGRPNEGRTLSNKLTSALAGLGIPGAEIVDAQVGPSAIVLNVRPPAGARVSQLLKLDQDLASELTAPKLRLTISATHERCMQVEIPRVNREFVALRNAMASTEYRSQTGRLAIPIPLGMDGSGILRVMDLEDAPHMMVAGTPGSGKSAFLQSLLSAIILARSPKEARIAVIDPKGVDFTPFGGAPHALCPVVTEVPSALALIDWLVGEMDRRYRILQANHVVKIAQLPEGHRLPRIVVVADEVADMMLAGKKAQREELTAKLARLVQKARACGIILVLATQRPTVDVMPGLIRQSAPTRVAFLVQSGQDSRIILDTEGAEMLAGKGDALVQLNGAQSLIRVQTPFVALPDVESIVQWWNDRRGVAYEDSLLSALRSAGFETDLGGDGDDPDDPDAPDGPDTPGPDDPDADGAEAENAEPPEIPETSAQPVGESDEANWYDAPSTPGTGGVATDDRRGAGYRNPWDRDHDDPEGQDD